MHYFGKVPYQNKVEKQCILLAFIIRIKIGLFMYRFTVQVCTCAHHKGVWGEWNYSSIFS